MHCSGINALGDAVGTGVDVAIVGGSGVSELKPGVGSGSSVRIRVDVKGTVGVMVKVGVVVGVGGSVGVGVAVKGKTEIDPMVAVNW